MLSATWPSASRCERESLSPDAAALIAELWVVALLSAGPSSFWWESSKMFPQASPLIWPSTTPSSSSPQSWSRRRRPSGPVGPQRCPRLEPRLRRLQHCLAGSAVRTPAAGVPDDHAVGYHRLLLPALPVCLGIIYRLIRRELWTSQGPRGGWTTARRERGRQQTVRVLSDHLLS